MTTNFRTFLTEDIINDNIPCLWVTANLLPKQILDAWPDVKVDNKIDARKFGDKITKELEFLVKPHEIYSALCSTDVNPNYTGNDDSPKVSTEVTVKLRLKGPEASFDDTFTVIRNKLIKLFKFHDGFGYNLYTNSKDKMKLKFPHVIWRSINDEIDFKDCGRLTGVEFLQCQAQTKNFKNVMGLFDINDGHPEKFRLTGGFTGQFSEGWFKVLQPYLQQGKAGKSEGTEALFNAGLKDFI